jgi:hypothetical protein
MKERQVNSAVHPIGFMLVLKTDHITGATGRATTLNLTISKDGAPFANHDKTSSVYEVGYGWYNWSPAAADRDTPGELRIHVDETTCDPYDEKYDIVQYDPYAAISLPVAERNAIADAVLTRDWGATVAAIVTIPARCLLQAMRLLRNKWAIDKTSGVLTVYAEDGQTQAWQMTTQSQVGADPIVGQIPS